MPTLNAEFQAALHSAVEAEFGEPAVITPRTQSEYFQGTPDENAPPYSVVATFRHEVSTAERQGRDNGVSAKLAFSQCEAAISKPQLAGQRKLMKGDQLTFPERENSPSYVIDAIHDDGKGRTVLTLQKIAS